MGTARARIASSTAAQSQKPKGKPRGRPFAPGNNANPTGRPVGSRQKLSEKFIDVLSADFEQYGEETIKKLRKDKPDAYVRTVADLVPRDINLNADATDAFKKWWEIASSGQMDGDAE